MLSVCRVSAPGTAEEIKTKAAIPLTLPAVLGRGPLLKCAETKVSRRHSTLDWDEDGVVIQAAHSNPTLVSVAGVRSSLSKGQSATLYDGDMFGMLPNTAWYRVNLPNSEETSNSNAANTVGSSNSDTNAVGDKKKPIDEKDKENDETTNVSNGAACNKRRLSKEEEATNGHDAVEQKIPNAVDKKQNMNGCDVRRRTAERKRDQTNDKVAGEQSETEAPEVEKLAVEGKKPTLETKIPSLVTSEVEEPVASGSKRKGLCAGEQSAVQSAVNHRARALPAWMTQQNSPAAAAAAAAAADEKPKNPPKKRAKKTNETNVKTTPAKRKPKVKIAMPKKGKVDYNDASDNDDHSDGVADNAKDSKPSPDKPSPKKQSVKCTDTPKKAGPFPGKKRLHYMSDSDSDDDLPLHSYPAAAAAAAVGPSPVKRNVPAPAKPKQGNPSAKVSSKADDSVPSATTAGRFPYPPPKTPLPATTSVPATSVPATSVPAATTSVPVTTSVAGTTTTTASTPAQGSASKRKSCSYGASCYRRNAEHRKDEAHPGDSDYSEGADSDAGSDDGDDRPECEFGVDCYRKNPQHKRDYKHTRLPQPQRQAKRKARKRKTDDGDSDDSYDYDDPFLNDESEDDYAPTDSDDDSEYTLSQPATEEERKDLKRAKKEANRFLKRGK